MRKYSIPQHLLRLDYEEKSIVVRCARDRLRFAIIAGKERACLDFILSSEKKENMVPDSRSSVNILNALWEAGVIDVDFPDSCFSPQLPEESNTEIMRVWLFDDDWNWWDFACAIRSLIPKYKKVEIHYWGNEPLQNFHSIKAIS